MFNRFLKNNPFGFSVFYRFPGDDFGAGDRAVNTEIFPQETVGSILPQSVPETTAEIQSRPELEQLHTRLNNLLETNPEFQAQYKEALRETETLISNIEHGPYHKQEHFEDVRVFALQTALDLYDIDPSLMTPEAIAVMELTGLTHDYEVKSVVWSHPTDPILNERLRFGGWTPEDIAAKKGAEPRYALPEYTVGNEYKSMEVFKERVLAKYPKLLAYADIAAECMQVTYPVFSFEGGMLDVYSRYLNEETSPVALIMELADLMNKAGSAELADYWNSSYAEMREIAIGITSYLESTPIEDIPLDIRVLITNKILGWTGISAPFVHLQGVHFKGILENHHYEHDYIDSTGVTRKKVIDSVPNKAFTQSEKHQEIAAYLRGRLSRFDENEQGCRETYDNMLLMVTDAQQQPEFVGKTREQILESLRNMAVSERSAYMKRVLSNQAMFGLLLDMAGYAYKESNSIPYPDNTEQN